MKQQLLKITAGCILLAGMLQACTKGFTGLNTDPTKPSTAPPDALITGAEKAASDVLYNNFVNGKIGMLYSQYWSQTQKESDSQYKLDEACNNTLWGLYSGALSNLQEVVRLSSVNAAAVSPNEAAIANILSVWLYQTLADVYGNVPYHDALTGLNNFTPHYDSAQAIYDSLVQKLDAQVAVFDTTKSTFKTGELIYQGNLTKWRKLANSLKLRIGIRMADAAPEKSKQVVEAAAAAGVLQPGDDALFPYLATTPDQFPFNEQSGTGIPNDYVMCKTLVDFMTSLKDPRLPVYARPTKGDGSYQGKPYGLGLPFGNDFTVYSYPGTRVYAPDFPGIVCTYSEVEFALAEAAARGYAVSGTAEGHYQNAIAANMKFWGIADTAAQAYITTVPYDAANWRNSIGTQKWLALYMQGIQSWIERVRLNFKKTDGSDLFTAPNSLDPTVQLVPYRLTYPISEGNVNSTNYHQAGEAIGGDTKGTKLWWNRN
ncbi:SusD/RagB family nutrient-binding outer membrane lipoprotein [Deminuibacter soli]|uniref:SusD/RagB family nutrient-binding outer membrane lipoprotein n=1 Tax=Deminuibacter soli TaxID=2291815 RepID=A0A3E1NF52_9BACT|nr:SusD/RagB family nutrient-binding outer membrane lipoprotein [Deminuibacter soli]RFM26507.1 SusD/RagB family nutrient-binding outer membrane lipoprotein [Deminuibacter soli]